MLIARPFLEPAHKVLKVKRCSAGESCDRRSAFSLSEKPTFALRIARRLGVCGANIVFINDKTAAQTSLAFSYADTNGAWDTYTVTLPLDTLCDGTPCGLFYYKIELLLGNEVRYLSSVNNIDFIIEENEKDVHLFRLLVYADGYKTPDWAKSAVMYQIFVDRFAKSDTHTLPVRENACINSDWENGIPKYAPYPGAPLDNNEFFGGSLYGVTEKLPYLKEMGVNLLYLCPIFKAYSNHKYDTGDYMTVDEMFGGDKALAELLQKAKRLGIRVILDGVFNHTGDDSLYFNRYGRYPDHIGAYENIDSPYHNWYYFEEFPNKYDSWWGIDVLPKLNNRHPDTREFFLGKNGVVRHYLKKGTDGWRLDVADELPSEFLTELRVSVKAENPEALILGEVWENAADKVAYGYRREYLSGFQLDSVMNYPIKNAIIDYVKTGNAAYFYNTVTDIYSSYPPETNAVLMNHIGTHDTERILTVLGYTGSYNLSNEQKAYSRLSDTEREKGLRLLKIASLIQFTLPGMPSVFYGDEAGMEGFGDPFCRRPYPWGREDTALQEHYKTLMYLKRTNKALHKESLEFKYLEGGTVVYLRKNAGEIIGVAINLSKKKQNVRLSGEWEKLYDVFSNTDIAFSNDIDSETLVYLPSGSAVILTSN